MFRHTVKSILDRKVRLLLTAVAVMLGVASITGVLIAATGLNRAIDELAASVPGGADLVVRAAEPDSPPLPATLVEDVAAVPGVARAGGVVTGYAQLIGAGGDALPGTGLLDPPAGTSVDWSLAGALIAGGLPEGPDQVAIDEDSARSQGFGIGDTVQVVAATARPQLFEVVGILDLPSRRGAPLVGFDLATAAGVFDRPTGEIDTVHLEAEPGIDIVTLAATVAAAVGPVYEVVPAGDVAGEDLADPRSELGFLTGLLLAVCAFALLIGGLVIRNTFSIVVAQRTRELALLRCLGASPGQVRASVLGEAVVVGAAGSALGVAAGIGLARLLQTASESLDALAGLPPTDVEVAAWIVAAGLGTGLAVALVSALAPARRATRVPPLAAMRDDAPDRRPRANRRRRVVGWAVTGTAAVLVAAGATGSGGGVIAGGALFLFVGLEMLGPVAVPQAARVLGAPVAWSLGLPGRMARRNAVYAPGRTAATAMTLLIAVALVTFMAVWTASQKGTRHQAFDDGFTADYRIDVPGTDFSGPIDPALLPRLAALPEAEAVVPFGAPEDRSTTGVDPTGLATLLGGDVVAGDLSALADGTVAVSRDRADTGGWEVGDEVSIELTSTGRSERLTVVALYDSYMLDPRGLIEYQGAASRGMDVTALVTPVDFARLGGGPDIGWIYLTAAPGTEPDGVAAAIEEVLADYPTVRLQGRDQLRSQGDAAVDAGMSVVYGLFGLLVIISLFGIVNTMALSVHERTREIGLLRAVGLSRGQAGVMVGAEAVVIGLIGVVTGVAIGVALFWAMSRGAEEGSDLDLTLFLPAAQLALVGGLAIATAVAAAVPPGIRAARVDVLRAVTME